MATAREEGSRNRYESGGGYGRFQNIRRTHRTTPYDRPPTAIRNPSRINNNNDNISNGWLSKLVDPAQRLITSSAHRLFASVFRKRLPPPPPQPPEPEANQEARDNRQETISSDPNGMRERVTNAHDNPSTPSDRGGLTELEQILKQKTFTRSEIDHLTTLLHSKSVDLPVGNEEKRSEVIPLKPVISHDRKEEFPKAPIKENGVESRFTSTPAVNSSVLDEDIASPAELAKAYMGSRPSKVSASMLGLRSQALREDSAVLSNRPFPSKSPIMSLVLRSSGHAGVPENSFVTPRSRGRSAIYSMARTPYSRVQSTATIKGVGPTIDASGGPSSSHSAWEQNRISGSKQGPLKRRSSVLDNDIGTVGPIRRIRQKSNLLSPKILSLPASGSPLSIHGIGIGPEQPSSSTQKPVLFGEPKHSFTKVSTENGDNSFPGTSFTTVPSKSSEVATKILQQLDMLVSSREKSPTKLSPSMLRGTALKSLENVDSSNLLENAQGNNKLDVSIGASLPNAGDYTFQKKNKVEENGPSKFVVPYGWSASVMNGVETAGSVKDNVPSVRTMDSAVRNSVTHPHPQKKRAFHMSAHEDYLELDDDDYSNGVASTPLAEGREKLDTSVVESKTVTTEAITMEKPLALSEVKASSNSLLNQNTDQGSSDGFAIAGKSIGFTFTAATSPSMTVQPAMVAIMSTLTSDKAASPKETNASPPKFSIVEKDALPKEPNSVAPTFSLGSKNVDVVPPFTFASSSSVVSESLGTKFAASSDPKPDSSNSFASIAAGAITSVPKVPESDKADNKNTLKPEVFFRTPETAVSSGVSASSSTASIFSFGTLANSSSLNNGSLASSPSSFSSPIPPLVSNNVTGHSSSNISTHSVATSSSSATAIAVTTANTNSGSISLSTSAAVPSLTAGPIFKFGSSVVPSTSTSTSSITATSGVESTEAKTKNTSFGNLTSTPFGGTSSAFTSAGSSIFGVTSPAISSTGSSIFGVTSPAISSTSSSIFGGTSSAITNTGSNIFGGSSSISSPGSSIFAFSAAVSSTATSQSQGSALFSAVSAQASAAGTGVASSTQSIPIQFGSSASSPSFGLAGNTAFSSGSSPFGSLSSTAKLFNSGTAFGSSSTISSSEANSVSSSSSTTSSVFGSGWQAPISPIFGSTFNSTSPSTGYPFGASSASIVATNSAPMVFGSSTGASSGSSFPFSSSAAATPSQPVFGNPNPSFPFGSAPSGNNDQMNMEDSMAEDTVQATTPTVPGFGQQPISTPSSFVFGSAAPSGANPFQFGGQPNVATAQNPSPFQASGSLDFNAGGSFSLGTGGGDKSNRKIVKVKHKQRKK